MASKSRLDKAGKSLAAPAGIDEYELLEHEIEFDAFRAAHLQPLSETTTDLQNWMEDFGDYYIAQRLKRKPQIVRKLQRFNTRLTQLQDIGGCRIIVDSNDDIENLITFIKSRAEERGLFNVRRITDYRPSGRDDSGYRSVHFIMERDGCILELQLRSKIQHYWAESIERTSVIYGYHLKEGEGSPVVRSYFKTLSDIFFEMEAGRQPSGRQKNDLDVLRVEAERIIHSSEQPRAVGGYVNEEVIKAMVAKEISVPSGLNNWLLVFDWSKGEFVTWDVVSRNPQEAMASYVRYENEFPTEDRFEVVLIGSSNVATVSRTHSHYFGIADFDKILEGLDQSIIGFAQDSAWDIGTRQILSAMSRKKFIGAKKVSIDTLKNHNCKNVLTFDASLKKLIDAGIVLSDGGISINVKRLGEIQSFL